MTLKQSFQPFHIYDPPPSLLQRAMQRLIAVFTGPLLKRYTISGTEAKNYETNGVEMLGNLGLKITMLMFKLGMYSSPVFLVMYLRKNGLVASFPEPPRSLVTVFALWGMILVTSYVARFFGRYSNNEYVQFADGYVSAVTNGDKTKLGDFLANYDFDFHAWPIAFRHSSVDRDETKPRQYLPDFKRNESWITALPCSVARWLIAHTVGVRLLFPGTVLSSFLDHHLVNGRSYLMLTYGGRRAKLETMDGNHIDSMFVDRRSSKTENGDFLVVCCEGNAGFYEIGIMGTPLEAGYSVLGWNHPGFAGSTGLPYPSQDLNAVDTVMQYAKHLGFRTDQIIIYAWSIGGFSSSWLAMNNPSVKAFIMDASFDDVVHLAKSVMPSWLTPLVIGTIKTHLNLNNADQVKHYPGPIHFIRRTLDEVICSKPGDLSSNRGNDLVLKVLSYRYPKVFSPDVLPVVKNWFALQGDLKKEVAWEDCSGEFEKFFNGVASFPSKFGEEWDTQKRENCAIYLLSKHVTDFDRTHCIPLPSRLFVLPWDVRNPK